MSSAKSFLMICLACCGAIARAGPPFVTDDPVPVDPHHTEVNLALQGTRADAGRAGTLQGVSANRFSFYAAYQLEL